VKNTKGITHLLVKNTNKGGVNYSVSNPSGPLFKKGRNSGIQTFTNLPFIQGECPQDEGVTDPPRKEH